MNQKQCGIYTTNRCDTTEKINQSLQPAAK